MAGSDPRGHFDAGRRGQAGRDRGSDVFRGRNDALTALRDWMVREESPGQPLVVIGQPGAGKSSVLARAVLALEREQTGSGLAFHTSGRTHEEFLAALGALWI